MLIRTWLITFAMAGVLGAIGWTQSPVTVSPTNMAEDIAQFRREFMAMDKSHSDANRAAAEKRLAALEAALATTTPAQFEIEIARIVALADNGHTNASALPRLGGHSKRRSRPPRRRSSRSRSPASSRWQTTAIPTRPRCPGLVGTIAYRFAWRRSSATST